ncbi:hypothetical protein DKX38_010702 [Salix brachista]|uniref:Uncharacterized protein n=1 Tax=Salix brachista TaxID=2182728 RepID=A0A5N5MGR5_9ROSI|nr:hypothetical protein DKX38_010702 [Salix brachista]
MNMCEKSLFLRAKTTIILFLILLSASSAIVVAARTSSFMHTEIVGSSSTYVTLRNRPIQPSGPYPCSHLPGDMPCKPPKRERWVNMGVPSRQRVRVSASSYYPRSNRQAQPSAPYPCSYIPGQGDCKPPTPY